VKRTSLAVPPPELVQSIGAADMPKPGSHSLGIRPGPVARSAAPIDCSQPARPRHEALRVRSSFAVGGAAGPGPAPPSVSGRRSRFAAQRLRHRPSLTTPDWVDPPYSVLATPRVRTLVRPTQPGATVSGPEDSFSRIIPVHCMGSNTSRTNVLEQSPGHFGPRDRLATHAPTHLSGPRTYWVDTRVRGLCY